MQAAALLESRKIRGTGPTLVLTRKLVNP